MEIEVRQNEEISRGGRERIGSAIRWGGANRGAYTLRNDTEEELLRDVDPYIIKSKDQAKKERW